MSKDSDPKGLSRILKLSLDAAFGKKTPAHAATVRAQPECKAETDGDSAASNPVTSLNTLEVESVCVVFQEDAKNLDRQAGDVSKSPVCKSGRGRGRKLAEKCSRPGLLLQNGEECVALNSCESHCGDIDSQRMNVSLGVATMVDVSVTGKDIDSQRMNVSLGVATMVDVSVTEKDIAEIECVDVVLLTNTDKQRVALKKEVTCELPDLVKCQISAGNINSTQRKKELNTVVGKQERSSNISALEELPSNSSTLDRASFSDNTMAGDHLLPSKTSISETDISTREKYPHRVEKQATKAAHPFVAPRKGKAAPDSAWFFRGKKTGQQFGARHRNYYKKDRFFSGLPERNREARTSQFLKQPGLDDHVEAARDNLKYMGNLSKKQTQDRQFYISGKDTFRTQSREQNKQVRGWEVEKQGVVSKAKQQEGDASKAKQQEEDGSKSKQQEGDASKGKQQEGDASKGKQQEGDASKGKLQEGDASKRKQQEGDASKAKQQEGDASKGKLQEGDASKAKQQEGDATKGKLQEGGSSKGKLQEGDASKGKQQEGNASKGKLQEGDASKSKQHEGNATKGKLQEGGSSKGKQQEGGSSKGKQQERDASKGKQQEGDASKDKQEGQTRYGKQWGYTSKCKQEGDASKCEQQEGDVSKVNQHMGEDRKAKQKIEDPCKAKHGGDHGKAKQHEGDHGEAKHKGDVSKIKQQKGDASKAEQQKRVASEINKQESSDWRCKQFEIDEIESEHQEGNDSEASGQETDSSKYKHKLNVNEYKQCGKNVSQCKQEAQNVKAKQQEVTVIKSKQQQWDKLQVIDNSKCKQSVGPNEADQGGDECKAKQNEGDGRKANKQKGDNRMWEQHVADSASSKDKVGFEVNETRKYFTIRDSPGEMDNMKNLDSDKRWGEQQKCLLVRESKALAIDTLTNRLCQDTSEMPERDRHISVQSKEDTSLKNLENFSSENVGNSVLLNVIVDGGKPDGQESVLGTCSEFVGCNSSVHTMITAIYQSYEQETIQQEDTPAEIPGDSRRMSESIDVEYVLEEASAPALEKGNLECFVSSTEKDVVAVGGESAADKKTEECTFVQNGEGSLYVYAEGREVIKSASEERIGNIVCTGNEEIDSGLAALEKQEVIICEVSASVAKDNIEGNNYLSENKGEQCVFASGEEGDDVFPAEQKREVSVSASEQKGEIIVSASEQKGEVKISACKVTVDTLRKDDNMFVKNVNYETVTINQDLENDYKFASVSHQEIPPCDMSDISYKCSPDLPTSIESEHSRLREANLIQNLPEERSADHCTSVAPNVMMNSPNERSADFCTSIAPNVMTNSPNERSADFCTSVAPNVMRNSPNERSADFCTSIAPNVMTNSPNERSADYCTSIAPNVMTNSPNERSADHCTSIAPNVMTNSPNERSADYCTSIAPNVMMNSPNERSADHCTSIAPNVMMNSPNLMINQARQPHPDFCDASHQYNFYTSSRHPDSYSVSNLPLYASEEKQDSSSPAPFFDTQNLSMPAETFCSEAAGDKIMAFITSCSTNIQQYMTQYNENQPLDVTISLSLTHRPTSLSDYTPRLPYHHANLWGASTARPPCPPPIFPYPGWFPAHPAYWNWWPWFERYPSNIPTPGNSIPFPYTHYPPTMCPESRGSLPPDVHHLPPSQPSAHNQGPAPRAPADYLFYPQMFSPWHPAFFDYPGSRQRYCTPEMATNHTSVNEEGVENSRTRWQTSEDRAEGKTWNDDHSPESSEQLTETVVNLHQKGYLLDYPRNETADMSSRSWEGIKCDYDRPKGFTYDSISSCLSKERLANDWTSRTTPPASIRRENFGDFFGTATTAASQGSQSSSRNAEIGVIRNSSNKISRSGGFEPKLNSVHQAARRKSAPYHRTKPWAAHQTQNRRRLSYPASGQCNNMGENKQVESKTSCPSPPDDVSRRKWDRDWAMSFVARSRSYTYTFIDSHCHIDYLYSKMEVPRETSFSKFQQDHADMFPCNYEGCVAVFCNPNTFNADNPKDHILQNISMEDGIWLAVGCHPKNANEFTDAHLRGLRSILKHPKVVALGEIGLDYSGIFRQYSDVQKLVFRQQLELALELKLPLVIHCRDADDDCLQILTQMVPSDYKIHAHCFTRHFSVAMRWITPFPNLFLGLTPVVTYKTALDATNTAELIPLDKLLLETDSPYFVPNGLHQDIKYSHPGFALLTAERVAQLKNISVDEVLKACRENTNRMYGI